MARAMTIGVIIFLLSSLLICASPASYADQVTIPLDRSIYGMYTNDKVEAHLDYLEIGDDRKASTQTSTPLDRVKWLRLFYRYENHGDTTADGYLKLVFIDDYGNEYTPAEGVYTGERVYAHSTSNLEFIEIPIPKGANIVTIRVIQGFDHTDFPVPEPGAATPTVASTATATARATAAPTGAGSSNGGPGSCLPLLPFAILGMVGLAGAVATKRQTKK